MKMSQSRFEDLRNIENAQQRGYLFEQYVREDLPWSFRPPIAVNTLGEQLDAFFEFNGWHFLVECKAKTGAITPGSHDWEDFELKLRRRGGSCIGLFCSLWAVSKEIHNSAANLNRNHHTTIIISGDQWDDLAAGELSHDNLLRYLVSEARASNRTIVPPLAEVQSKILTSREAEQRARAVFRSGSTTFLRRHRSPRHEQTYVNRLIDTEIKDMLSQLAPTRLANVNRSTKRGDKTIEHIREAPFQLAIVRDLSGAGKTTLSAHFAGGTEYISMAKAALEPNIDAVADFLDRIGPRHGLGHFVMIDKPFLYVIDSLDEATAVPHKASELKSLFNVIDNLNREARNRGLLCYPILLVVTVREDYWRSWESQLEGRKARIFNRRFSRFTDTELLIALGKYQFAYDYQMEFPISSELREALSHPFTLQVYSEANEYTGPVKSREHFGFRVLTLYFERKKEDILKRPIVGFDGEVMMAICASIAAEMVKTAKSAIIESRALQIIIETDPVLSGRASAILMIIKSELILVPDDLMSGYIRFRHGRFLEYMVAFHILNDLRKENTINDDVNKSSTLSTKVATDARKMRMQKERIEAVKNRDSLEYYNMLNEYIERYKQSSIYSFSRAQIEEIKDEFEKYENEAYNIEFEEFTLDISTLVNNTYELIAATTFVSPYIVLDYLKSIASDDTELVQRVRNAFSSSTKFMNGFLSNKRSEISNGGRLETDEARAIQLSMADRDPSVCWEGFFVLAAANSHQTSKAVREAFILAWDANKDRNDLYKIIPKLTRHKILLDEDVLWRISKSRDYKCWLSFIEQFDEVSANIFPRIWIELEGETLENEITSYKDENWDHVLNLLEYLKAGKPYPRGELTIIR